MNGVERVRKRAKFCVKLDTEWGGGMNHTLPGTEKTLQNDHVLGVEALSVSESVLDGLLSFGKHKLVEGLLLWEHLKFHILKVTRRKGKTLIDLSQVFFGPAEDVDVLDLLGSSLNKVLGDAQKGAKIHKVIHRIEHWCSSDQPLDIRSEITNTLECFAAFVPDLMGFVKNNTVPHDIVERSCLILPLCDQSVRCDDHFGLHIELSVRTIENTDS